MRRAAMAAVLALIGACTEDNPSFIDPTQVTPCDEGRLIIESFDLATPERVDVLLVVDNSAGTETLQEALSDAMPAFVAGMEALDLDYHLGVVSTDVVDPDEQGRLQTGETAAGCPANRPLFVAPETPGAATTAACNVLLGQDGDEFEAGLDAVRYALHPDSPAADHNAGFLRNDARLVVIVVSDENDCSDDGALPRQDPRECEWHRDDLIDLDIYHDFFDLIRPNNGTPVDFVAIVGPDDGNTYDLPEDPLPVCVSNGEAFNGRRYIDVVEHMPAGRGGFYNVCARGYGPILADVLEAHVAPRPERVCPQLHLTQEPVSVRLAGGQPETVAPIPNGAAGYLYEGPVDECETGALLIAPGVQGSIAANERVEVHYCTSDELPQ